MFYFVFFFSFYQSVQSRTDLWMYLMLFKFGGVYASMDATCELPLQKLIRADDDMLVGHQPVLTSRVLQRQVGS